MEENLKLFSGGADYSFFLFFVICWALPFPLLIYDFLTFKSCTGGENEQHVSYTLCGVNAL